MFLLAEIERLKVDITDLRLVLDQIEIEDAARRRLDDLLDGPIAELGEIISSATEGELDERVVVPILNQLALGLAQWTQQLEPRRDVEAALKGRLRDLGECVVRTRLSAQGS